MSYEEPGILNIRFQNEIDFCTVNETSIKNQIERILMRNQIAFAEDWGGKLFSKSTRCNIRININMAEKARELIENSGLDLSKIEFLEIKHSKLQLDS